MVEVMDINYNYIKSKGTIFSDAADSWLLFRKKRFAAAGDGEYAMLENLDLSGLDLHDFVSSWLVFAGCKLDSVSFRGTDFTFRTAFVYCSLKRTDFTASIGGDDLFYNCDLSDAIFDLAGHWASVDLDGKKIPSYFVNCTMSKGLRDFLVQDKNVVIEGEIPSEVQQQLDEITKAPSINVE